MIKSIFTGLFIFFAIAGFGQTYKVEEVTYKFEIHPVQGINSQYNDFSPVALGDKLIFTSGRESNLVLEGENNWGKTGFINVFEASFKEGIQIDAVPGAASLFSEQIANNNHTGPVCFTATGDTLFFTQLAERQKRQKEVRYPQLFMAIRVDGKWENIQKLPFCDESASFGHPSWDPVKSTLYFASSMKGGKGGKDIYSVRLSNGTWETPKNLNINTEADEMFPHISGGDLFFSSNRTGGKGGLDIYWKMLNTPVPVQNLEALNGPDDDHGLFISIDKGIGFFATKQDGNDDIFMLTVERNVRITNELMGQFTYRKLGTKATDLNIELLYEDEMVMTTATNEEGVFSFRELPYENYTIKSAADDNLELVLFNKEGDPVTYLIQDGNGLFQYKKINLQQAGTLGLMSEMGVDDNMEFGKIDGQFAYENLPGVYSDSMRVMLVDENGEIAFETYTDKRGNFSFNQIPTNTNYIITTEDVQENMYLFIFDEEGKVVTQLKQNNNGQFVFKKIDPDYANNLQYLASTEEVFELNTMTLTGNFNYRELEGQFSGGLTVYLYDENGFLLDSAITNEKGEFRFNSLDPKKSYLFKMNEDDPNFVISDFNLYVEDRYGNVVADLVRGSEGFFEFRKLEQVAGNNLNTKDEENLDFALSGQGVDIFFESNSSYANLKGNQDLQGLIGQLKTDADLNIQIFAYADPRATETYNQWLSERRGERVKNYLIRNGISPSRITVVAYGESKATVTCENGEDCDDQELAKNRKVQVVIVK